MTYLLVQASANHLPLADESVQTCVTSPPYWGLRSYAGEQEQVWGGDPECAHEWGEEIVRDNRSGNHLNAGLRERDPGGRGGSQNQQQQPIQVRQGAFCRCGAWRGALGLEPTPDLFVAHMVEVFREVRRVLRPDATLWLNLGDSYAGGGGFSPTAPSTATSKSGKYGSLGALIKGRAAPQGLKPKDLIGIPWRVAFALQADGWYLRSDIIWHKPNPMPESVTDRPTKAHEYLFLLTKSERYYYDADAIREQAVKTGTPAHLQGGRGERAGTREGLRGSRWEQECGRNKRDVWTIATTPYPGAHFATFPEALVEPCILAGSAPGDVVLDPFTGSGTTGRVALRHGRSFVGVDISRNYLDEQAIARIDPLTAQKRDVSESGIGQGVLL